MTNTSSRPDEEDQVTTERPASEPNAALPTEQGSTSNDVSPGEAEAWLDADPATAADDAERMQRLEADLREEIRLLSRVVWEGRGEGGDLEHWLRGFEWSAETDEVEQRLRRLHALYLLSRFTYLGEREVRAMLQTIYTEFYRHPIVTEARRNLNDPTDRAQVNTHFLLARGRTRFMGVGNPAESGTHLLYYFRQENSLPKELFANAHQALQFHPDGPPKLADPDISRYIFLDDFCGSGHQAEEACGGIVASLKDAAKREGVDITVSYYVLVARAKGLASLRAATRFDELRAVLTLDESFSCFSNNSRYFRSDTPEDIDVFFAKNLCYLFGNILLPRYPFGYDDCELLLGFPHNTPDNTLPIFWMERWQTPVWHPIFRRYQKLAQPQAPGDQAGKS